MATDDVTKTYTTEEVQAILSTFRATPRDYLIHTYFKICKITQGPLYSMYERRFNNILFNNVHNISRRLTTSMFLARARGFLKDELRSVKFISCIFPNKLRKGHCPVFLQFFHKYRGIQVRLLEFTSSPSSLGTVLFNHDIVHKIVGYCGDYCYRDTQGVSFASDHFSTVNIFAQRKVKDLPYREGFIKKLFDLLVDYLPDDMIGGLVQIGEIVTDLSGNSQFAKQLVNRYSAWKGTDQHILLSDFTKYVSEHYNAVNSFLEPCQCLPFSVSALLSNVLQRFLVVFMRELYLKIDQITLSDNNAVVYYFDLLKIKKLFGSYAENQYVQPEAWSFLNAEIDHLVANGQIKSREDNAEVTELLKEVVVIVDGCYMRALTYLQQLLDKFEHFDAYAWLLLDGGPLQLSQVHEAYHLINENLSCQDCAQIEDEVKRINSVMVHVPCVDIESVAERWIALLQMTKDIPIVTDLVHYLLSLPASCQFVGIKNSSEYERACSIIRVNFQRHEHEDFVDKIEEFFDLDAVSDIIKNNTIPLLAD